MEFTGELTVNFYLHLYGEDCVLADLSRPVLQRCNLSDSDGLDAFQEVVSDLYDGFLSEEDRVDIKHPDYCVVAPIVAWISSWSRSEEGKLVPNGPCTLTADELEEDFGIETGIVNLPAQYADHGLFAWAALGHEAAGHDILSADEGLIDEMRNALKVSLLEKGIDEFLAEYWSYCIEETASDVMGILNMGPAVGIALIGYFRALNAALTKKHEYKLWNFGIKDDIHPADILRGYLAASVVRRLEFSLAGKWADFIKSETDKDLGTIRLNVTPDDPTSGVVIDSNDAKKSADIAAETVMNYKLKTLEDHALGEIQNWKDDDEAIVNELISSLTTLSPIPDTMARWIYAAHVVAAAVVAALAEGASIDLIFNNMVSILKIMHDENPVWKLPVYLEHPGDIDLGRRNILSRLSRRSNAFYRRYGV